MMSAGTKPVGRQLNLETSADDNPRRRGWQNRWQWEMSKIHMLLLDSLERGLRGEPIA